MQSPVSMYYANLTNIDLAMIMPDGRLRGDSFNLHLELVGAEDPEEAVLIDFSTAKKSIKSWIDDHTGNGFDHKCWLFDHKDAAYHLSTATSNETGKSSFCLETDSVLLTAPDNCFRIIPCNTQVLNLQSMMRCAELEMELYLEKKFAEAGQQISVTVGLTNNFSYPVFAEQELQGFSFRYTHGLKKSTSFGCKNIVHGHASYITFKEKENVGNFQAGKKEFYKDTIEEIVSYVHNKVFAWEQNVSRDPQDNSKLIIEYTTERGYMRQVVDKQNCIVLNVETTVEHIAQFIANEFEEQLTALDVDTLYVSEGLEKGGCAYPSGCYSVHEIKYV